MQKIKGLLLLILLSIIYHAKSQTLLKTITAHEGGVTSLYVSNDASIMLSGGMDAKTYVWDFKTGSKLKGALKHDGNVTCVAISANNKFYVSGSADTKIRVFDLVQNIPVRILTEYTTEISVLSINPVNDFIAAAAQDNSIKIWDNSKSKVSLYTLKSHEKKITGLAFSPDGKILCSSSLDNTVKCWNAATGELIKTIETELKGVTCVNFSSDGKYLAAGGLGGNIGIWEVATGIKKTELTGYKSAISCVAFSPDVQYVAAGGEDKKILIWRLETGKLEKNFIAHEADITGVSFSHDGDVFASSGMDGSIKLWDVQELNIGNRKFLTSEGSALLKCSNGLIADENNNGFLESGEKATITFDITNEGTVPAYHIVAKISLDVPNTNIFFNNEFLIGNVDANKKQTVTIPVSLNSGLLAGSNAFNVSMSGAHATTVASFKLNFQTRDANNFSYIVVTQEMFSSATGKAEIGVPITAKIKIKNIAKAEARNIKISFLFPEHVAAVDKISQIIPFMAAGEEKEIQVQFYADKEFKEPEIKVSVDVQGAAFSNAKNVVLVVKMNESLENDNTANVFDSKVSPLITMVQPRAVRNEKIIWLEEEITLKGEINSPHQIHQFLVNGKEVPLSHKTFNYTVKLAYKDNPFIMRATDIKGNVTEHNFIVQRQMKIANVNDTLKRQGADYALIIVTDEYENYNSLSNPVNDGQTIAKELEGSYGFKTEVIKNPLYADIYAALRRYSQKVYHDDDQLLIFIAGHGEFDDVFSEGYIVTKDSKKNDDAKQTYISHSNLRTIINNIPCKHILLTMDVCFGGTFDQFVASSRGEDLSLTVDREKFIQRKLQYMTRKYLTSGGKEYVPDGRPGEHSPFARKYLEALRSYGGQDGILTFNELYTFVEKTVPGPKTGEFGNNQPGSDFLFIYKK